MDEAIHALLVGVDDYSTYDASAGLAPGTSDLRGAANDARLLARTLSRLTPDVRVCLNPTRAALEAELEGLADALARGGRGVVAFSGHGDADARGPLLCPADVTVGLEAALPFDEVTARLERRAPGAAVTSPVDACAAGRGPGVRALRGGSAPAPWRLRRDEDVLLAAAAAGAPSHEHELHGRWQGAFTWAVTSLLDRWGVSDGGPWFGLSHGLLLRRARTLLGGLAVDQTPQYAGRPAGRRAFVLGRRAARAEAPPALATRELSGGHDGYILQGTGGAIGFIRVRTSTVEWHWTHSTAAFPSHFWIRKSGTAPATNFVVTTERHTFPSKSTACSLSGVQWAIKQGGSLVGYLQSKSGTLIWYSSAAIAEFPDGDMEFAPNTDTSTRTLHSVADPQI
jgi:hypothetical protein